MGLIAMVIRFDCSGCDPIQSCSSNCHTEDLVTDIMSCILIQPKLFRWVYHASMQKTKSKWLYNHKITLSWHLFKTQWCMIYFCTSKCLYTKCMYFGNLEYIYLMYTGLIYAGKWDYLAQCKQWPSFLCCPYCLQAAHAWPMFETSAPL